MGSSLGQNAPESIALQLTPAFKGDRFALIITDTLQRIVAISDGQSFRPSKSFPMNFRVYGVAYTGKLSATLGSNIASVKAQGAEVNAKRIEIGQFQRQKVPVPTRL